MGRIELYSPTYFVACGIGGIFACGPTHTLVTPLDLVKCRRQVKPDIYKGVFDGWRTIYKTEGIGGVFTGFGPTAIGYSLQGAGKYGLYEFFKYYFNHMATERVGEDKARKYRAFVYLSASAAAEFVADIFLCPWEALKVRMQTSIDPPFAKATAEGFKKLKESEGFMGFYKGLGPLWARQIPYTMMKFASFEATVEMIYSKFLSRPKEEYNKLQQLGVSFVGGYTAGVLCAAVSHPADVIVSKLNNLPKPEPGQPRQAGVIDITKELGWKGVWRGLGTRIAMIGTLTALQWLFYDTFKVNVGLPTTGAAK
ncbi:Cu/Pi carrier [Apophysomyces ossiformis]|uniref:Cu/Pi carrier n=1 Tax=Apophysomyces ossiformis TaxID=679940 RepID=A0A8H7BMU8_9FUNG|nr:Cu/Pi carrier [Apophysomyces ossiformis]